MDGNRDAIRLNSVRRIDPHVSNIVDSANRTALYSYQEGDESWAKTDVEGTLMVYTRVAPPHNMVTIINRLNKSNFIEPLTTTCDIQIKSPYLLFRNAKGIIYGIWFSEEEDVQRIAVAISEKMKEEVPSHTAVIGTSANVAAVMAHPTVAVAGGVGGGDIMSMLSRAHGEFATKCQGQQQHTTAAVVAATTNNDVVKPSPVRVQAGEQNTVADFFAKVSGATTGSMTGLGGGGPLPSPSNPPGGMGPQSTGPAVSAHNPVLQKLFQGAAAVGGAVQMPGPTGDLTPSNPIPIPGTTAGHAGAAAGGNVGVPPAAAAAPISLSELEGRFKDNLRVGSHENQAQVQQLTHKQQQHQHQQQHQQQPLLHQPQGIQASQPLQPQLQQQLYSVPLSQSDHPSLLSPQVFTTSRLAEGGSTPPTSNPLHPATRIFPGLLTPGTAAALDMRPLNGSQESLHDFNMNAGQTVTPLTQEQLVQAFTLLLKKDDFVKQLHQAYVQVLNQSLKGCL